MSDLEGLNLGLGEVKLESSNFTALPKGEYAAEVEKAELRDTKKGGKMIKLELRLHGGKGIGKRKVFDNIMLVHSNPKVVEIGKQKLKSLAIAGGMEEAEASNLKSSADLVGLQVTAGIKVEKSEEYGDQNRVTHFKRYDEALADKTLADVTEDSEDTGL